MSLANNDGNGMVMPVSPMYGGGGTGWGNGFGGDGAWWLLVLLFALGNNGFGEFGGNAAPYMMSNTDNAVQRGFDQQAVMSGIGSVSNGINGLQNTICNAFATAESSDNARQMANMQQMFNLQAQLSGLGAIVQAENCNDRQTVSDGVRDILVNQTANTQRLVDTTTNAVQGIYDKLCQLELNAKDDKIADLQRQLTTAQFAASQTSQTARILADNAAQTVALEQYLNPTAVPAYVVPNPNCCNNNYGYSSCGCNG